MKRLPSVKKLTLVFGDRAKEARELLEKKRKTTDYKSVQSWESQCYNRPRYIDRLLCALNEIAGTHGVEPIYTSDMSKPYWPEYQYLNTGDPYATTLIYCDTGRFYVGCWGDIVERIGSVA